MIRLIIVMAGLVPAIHVLELGVTLIVDARHKAGHDGGGTAVASRNRESWC